MEWLEVWWIWGTGVVLIVLFLAIKKTARPLRRLVRTNRRQRERIERLRDSASDPALKQAWDHVLKQTEGLHRRWFLDSEDLQVVQHSQTLVRAIARAFHPESETPWTRARIGALLHAFVDMQDALNRLVQIPGLGMLTRFRLRHLAYFEQARRTRERWDESELGRAARKWRLFFILRWANNLARYGDILFWMVKSGSFMLNDVVLRHVLVHWYLTLGDTAVSVYRDSIPETDPDLSNEDVLEDMESLEEPDEEAFAFPEEVRPLIETSRRELMLHTSRLTTAEIRGRLQLLAGDIAAFYYPDSPQPLQEATLMECLKSAARLCGQVAALETKPVFKQVLGLRLSHLLKVKTTADQVFGNQWVEWLKKYRVGSAVKYSTLAYRAFKKGQPGVIFKDVAFTLVQEGLKRWLALYLHGRVAEESVRVYRVYRPTSSR